MTTTTTRRTTTDRHDRRAERRSRRFAQRLHHLGTTSLVASEPVSIRVVERDALVVPARTRWLRYGIVAALLVLFGAAF